MNNSYIFFRWCLLLFGVIIISPVSAQDRLFTFTYQSNVLNKGQRELESWHTKRFGREDYYSRYDNRTEFEIGLGSNLQTAFYLNLTSKTQTLGEKNEKYISTTNEIGFSNEWKLKLLDPVAHPIGLALYSEVGIENNELEFEGKLIIDKKISNFTLAANGVFDQEYTPNYKMGDFEWVAERKIDAYLGLAWQIKRNFQLTSETAFRNVFDDGELKHSALFSGLGFSYILQEFWVNFTVLPQLTSFKGESNNSLNLNEFEKVQCRLLFSYEL